MRAGFPGTRPWPRVCHAALASVLPHGSPASQVTELRGSEGQTKATQALLRSFQEFDSLLVSALLHKQQGQLQQGIWDRSACWVLGSPLHSPGSSSTRRPPALLTSQPAIPERLRCGAPTPHPQQLLGAPHPGPFLDSIHVIQPLCFQEEETIREQLLCAWISTVSPQEDSVRGARRRA